MIERPNVLAGKILLVDDQPASLRLLERMLRGAGYTSVTSTREPQQVPPLHWKNRYDLILLDLQMPGMDGFQVLEGLKQVERDGYLSVLVMTAHPGHKRRALQAGAKDFIAKPFNAVEVLTRVYNLLELRLLHLKNRKRTKGRWSSGVITQIQGSSQGGRTPEPLAIESERRQSISKSATTGR